MNDTDYRRYIVIQTSPTRWRVRDTKENVKLIDVFSTLADAEKFCEEINQVAENDKRQRI